MGMPLNVSPALNRPSWPLFEDICTSSELRNEAVSFFFFFLKKKKKGTTKATQSSEKRENSNNSAPLQPAPDRGGKGLTAENCQGLSQF